MCKKILLCVFSIFMSLYMTAGWAGERIPDSVFKSYTLAEKSSGDVHAMVREAAGNVYPDPESARKQIFEVYRRLDEGALIDKYDYLWTQYGLLKSSFETGTAEFLPETDVNEYMRVARNVLAYLDTQDVGQWVYTELGAFQMEVYRSAANGLAWSLYEEYGDDQLKLEEGLGLAVRAQEYITGYDDYYIYDTKARILLKLGRSDEAFEIVDQVLSEDPDFHDFQDLKEDEAFERWKRHTR